ncbi:MAG: hypothetical protein AAF734_03745, partial [Bacteroidota bacterium]
FLFFLFCFVWLAFPTWAQEAPTGNDTNEDSTTNIPQEFDEFRTMFLALDKTYGKTRRFRYHPQSTIHFKMKGEDFIRRATIQEVKEGVIVINEVDIKLEDINAVVRYNNSRMLKQAQIFLPIAGFAYFLMDSFNSANTGETGFSPIPSTYYISGGLIGTGLFLRIFRKKTYTINERHFFKTIERSY